MRLSAESRYARLEMKILVCLIAGFVIDLQAITAFINLVRSHYSQGVGIISIIAGVGFGLVVAGLILIARWRSPISKAGRILIGAMIIAAIFLVLFECAQAMKAKKMSVEIKEKSNRILRQIDAVEQQWKIQHSNTTNEVLSNSEYELAQEIYRLFARDRVISRPHSGSSRVVPETNLVYCLCYGMANAPLPPDFMGVFTNPTPRVITGTNALLFSNSGTILERDSGRPVVILALRGLVIHGDSADLSIRYIDSSRAIAQIFFYKKQDGRWIYSGGSSTGAHSRWGS